MKFNYKKLWFLPLGIALAALLVALVMYLWNWLMPVIFGLTKIGFWQAAGLLFLAKLLFGGHWGGHHSCRPSHKGFGHHKHLHNRMHERWMNMSEEDRNAFIQQRMNRFHHHPFGPSDCWKNEEKPTNEPGKNN